MAFLALRAHLDKRERRWVQDGRGSEMSGVGWGRELSCGVGELSDPASPYAVLGYPRSIWSYRSWRASRPACKYATFSSWSRKLTADAPSSPVCPSVLSSLCLCAAPALVTLSCILC